MLNTKRYQAYYTKSTPIVSYMVSKLSLNPLDKVLEPCGGDGVFVEAILKEKRFSHIDIYELNPHSVDILHEKFSEFKNITIRKSDTLLDAGLDLSSSFGGIYDKIIANPPYGAWQDYDKRTLLKKLYPEIYAKETYALFLYRCIELLKEDGILSFIIPDTFLSLHMHKGIRKHILTKTQILELALFSSSFFPGVNFGYANLSIITLKKRTNYNSCLNNSFKVINHFNSVDQLTNTQDDSLSVCYLNQKDILNNPDFAFLITDNSNIQKQINSANTRIGDIANCVTGFYSGNDKYFLRAINKNIKNSKNYNLIDLNNICYTYEHEKQILDGIDNSKSFVPIVKGGNTKYLKPENWFMDWSYNAVKHYKTDKKARFQNSQYYFTRGIGVPMISSSNITASLIENKLFDQSIVGIFPNDNSLIYYLLAFFNSPTCNKLIRTINPSANNPANYIKKIPFIRPDYDMLSIITEKTKNIVESIKTTGLYDLTIEIEIHEMIKQLYKI